MKKYIPLILFACLIHGQIWAQAPQQRIPSQPVPIQQADVAYTGNAIRIEYNPVLAPLKHVTIEGQRFLSIDGFYDASRPGERAIPAEVLTVAIPPGSTPRLIVKDANYAPLSNVPPMPNPSATIVGDTAFAYSFSSLVTSPARILPAAEITGYGWVREYYCVYVQINTYRFDETTSELSALDRVSLELEFRGGLQQPMLKQSSGASDPLADRLVINAGSAAGWKSPPPLPERIMEAGDWISPSATYVKLRTGKDGIYRITGATLQQWGADLGGIQPGTLKIYESGEQVPIHVQSGGAFGPTDYIEFYGERNYTGDAYRTETSTDTESIPYLDRYNDSTTYWLTWGGEPGLRFADYALAAPADTILSYRHIEHFEQDNFLFYGNGAAVVTQFPNWVNKWWAHWDIKVGGANAKRNHLIPVLNVAGNSTAQLRFKVQSGAYSPGISPAHTVAGYINDAPEALDTLSFDALHIGIFNADFDASLLTEGTTKVTVESRLTQSPANYIVGDWIELEYSRELAAIGDRLAFQFDSPIAGQRSILLQGFTTDQVVVYKTGPDPRRFTALNTTQGSDGYSIWFGDELTGNDAYAASTVDSILTPAFVALRAPGQNPFADLRAPSNSADYIIVTHPILKTAAQQYAAFVASEYNVTTRVVDVMEATDEFSYGYFKPEGIRDFLQYAHSNWQRPGPQYVLFLGDAAYDYKDVVKTTRPQDYSPERGLNLVPSYGVPVGDAMLVLWDETDRKALPQMFHGRIPAVSPEDVLGYLERHRQYRNVENTEWNKRYLMFTGGLESNPTEIQDLWRTNDAIIQESVKPPPVSGTADHFYKTVNPSTHYGPFEPSYVANSIAEGAVFISYLGHSGTQTWDNGISQPKQLQNDVDRYSIISDFGCSTAKFAENEVISFSELFVLGETANAMAYIGNSALGQTGPAKTLSRYFYEAVLNDTIHTLGIAHHQAKQTMFARQSSLDIWRISVRINALIGDPILEAAVPVKPNFLVREAEVVLLSERLTNIDDSARYMMVVRNHGSAVEPPLEVRIRHTNSDTLISENMFTIPSPGYKDSVFFALPVKDLQGLHRFTVTLDPNDLHDEIIETDNEASVQFTVASSSVIVLSGVASAMVYDDEIIVMNPVFPPADNANTLHVEIGLSADFDAGTTVTRPVEFGTVVTSIPIADFTANRRYYYRYRIHPSDEWTGPFTFYRLQEDVKQAFIDSVSLGDASRNFIIHDNQLLPHNRTIDISLASAGFAAGKYAIVSYDGINLVQGEQLSGYYVALLDGKTKQLKRSVQKYFEPIAFSAFLDSVETGDILLASIADIGAPFGGTVWPVLRTALHQFGSTLIDSVRWRDSWCIVGVKGAAPGTANERYVPREEFVPAEIDTAFIVPGGVAGFTADALGPAGRWKEIRKTITGGQTLTSVAGITPAFVVDTLQSMDPATVQNLSGIDADAYPHISLLSEIRETLSGTPPSSLKMTLEYDLPAELALNYQTVSVAEAEVLQGTAIEATAQVHNVGELPASNVKIEYYVLTPANEKLLLKEATVPVIPPGGSHAETLSIPTAGYAGNAAFIVEADNAGVVREITRSNNAYSVPFRVLGDTGRPQLDVTIDGVMPFDGDYVRSRPDVVVKLFDGSPIPMNDASGFLVYLNDTLVIDNPDYDVTFQPGSGNEKGTITLRPVLEDGTHFFRFNAIDESGNKALETDMVVMVIVESDAALFDLYNVPNPFSGPTSFTFTLTGTRPPEDFEIKVYTVAGRLIRDIAVPVSQLRIGYNNIPWDGRDEDGDLLANGAYLYKAGYTLDGTKQHLVGKLAVLR